MNKKQTSPLLTLAAAVAAVGGQVTVPSPAAALEPVVSNFDSSLRPTRGRVYWDVRYSPKASETPGQTKQRLQRRARNKMAKASRKRNRR